jgi:acetoin utilization protein AcuB
VEETAQVLLENKISGAPVMDKTGKVIGTITQTDLFRVLISLTGVASGGIQFGFYLEDKPGSIKQVADIIRQYGGRMVSILTSYDGVADGYRNVFIRMHSVERSKLQRLKDKLSEKATLLYMIDQRQNKREIFSGPDN